MPVRCGPWQSCASSLPPVKRPAQAVTNCPARTVAEVLDAARERYGVAFGDVLATCRIWVNGESAADQTAIGPHDEVAVLPPVSGGSW